MASPVNHPNIRSSLCFIFSCVGVAVFAGCSSREAREFTTYSVIEAAHRILPLRGDVNGTLQQEIAFGTEVQTVVSVASTYDLKRRYWASLQRDGLAERIAAPYLGAQPYSAELGFSIFEPRVDIQLQRLTLLVRFGFTHHDPEVARLVADRMAMEYLEYEKESQSNEPTPMHSRLVSHAFPP